MTSRPLRALLYLVFFSLTVLVASLTGGFLVRFGVNEDPFLMRRLALYLGIYFSLSVALIFISQYLVRRERRILVFATFLFALLTSTSLFLANWTVSFRVPPWPVTGLRGVVPPPAEGPVNSWGQRDKERLIEAPPGVYRIAFIGDSFLEKPRSLNLLVEQALNRPDIEIINLGISGTAPDEYFYRLKNVALSLDIKHCFMFLYTGNDFVQTSTLKSILGVFAVYPRDSLARYLGLRKLNHFVTLPLRPYNLGEENERRFKSAEALRKKLHATTSDAEMAKALSTLVKPPHDRVILEKLLDPKAKVLLDAIRDPDEGVLGRGYLNMATSYGSGRKKSLELSEKFAYHWIERSAKLCRDNGIRFTLVVIPEAAQVDPRFRSYYLPLTDLQTDLAGTRTAAERTMLRAAADKIDVIDLFPVLAAVAGTYLNLDGHWSKKGFDIVSETLRGEIETRVAGLTASPAP